ncbi:MAG TPA: peptidylprolyl isomerase [Kofleriaceae bacterium]|nr:peptidylprolyl isomerase [Kofleriaceae bacterium]
MLRACTIVATALLVGCPTPAAPPRAADDRALRLQIAQAEARRDGGIAELVELAHGADGHARALALRGLGRIGGPRALPVLIDALGDRDRAVAIAAASALGVAASLDEMVPDELAPISAALVAALPRIGGDPLALEALGRAGTVDAQPALVEALGRPATAEAAALALARMGRRKLALSPAATGALVAAANGADPAVRYAATYALARAFTPEGAAPDEVAAAALAAHVADDAPAIRAVALAGLARRHEAAAHAPAIVPELRDVDPWVGVEAVRALAGKDAAPDALDAVIAALSPRLAQLRAGDAAAAHVVIEALRLLLPHGAALPAELDDVTGVPPLTRGWIECLASAVQRGDIDHCGHAGLPEHLRVAIAAELVEAGAGDVAMRRGWLRALLVHPDARVRAAGLGALATTVEPGDDHDADNRAAIASVASALAIPDPVLAGAAVDAASTIYDALPGDAATAALDAALVARAQHEQDPELSASLYELIGKRKLASGADACRGGLAAAPVRARAAAACLRALGEAAPAPPIGPATAPPVDVTAVIGHAVRWHVVTTRGEIVIDLRPDVAPWNVATIVALTRRGFYDGTELHRVVPDFVVQGGDPTGSGAGGPGFTVPAEPASSADGPGFVAGGVGIADAGRDSGGSQFFIMHSRASHLDGRYTWIGSVAAGQKYADALEIGDTIVKATVEVH